MARPDLIRLFDQSVLVCLNVGHVALHLADFVGNDLLEVLSLPDQ